MNVWAWVRAVAAGMVFMAQAAGLAHAAPPVELFFKAPDIGYARLSPSGRWLAMTSSQVGDRVGLVIIDLRESGKANLAARFDDADIDDFFWVSDDKLVFDVVDRQSGGAEQQFVAGLFAVGRDGSDLRMLIRPASSSWRNHDRSSALPANHVLLHVPDDGSNTVIVGEYRFSNTGDFQDLLPKRLNVETGRTQSLAVGAPDNGVRWWFDRKGEPRVILTRAKGRSAIHWKGPASPAWAELASFDSLKRPYTPRHVDGEGQLYVSVAAGPDGYEELRRFDLDRRQPQPEALVRAPGFDFLGRMVSETVGSKALGVRVETDAETTVWFDDKLKALQAEADRKLPGRVNRISCRRCGQADMVALIESFSDRDPGAYFVAEPGRSDWRFIGQRRKAIDPRQMGQRDFHRIKARDGRDLPVWVTTPPGPAAGPRPAVVLVHGGPWVRGGHWQWEALPQFLASRGYVVIEPEFRGSWGYGAAHLHAGFKQWGLAMQDDLADALLWASAKGLADRQRACIAGASYGGYATLMGLVRHPDLYRCGAAWVAVTDPKLIFKWSWISDLSDETREYDYPQLIGDPVRDAEQLKATSPLDQAARIKAPVLLAAGAWDRRVPLEHGTRMRDALKAAGNPAEWIVYDDEGHGWALPKNRIDFARRLEDFLERKLKSAAPAAPAVTR